MSPGISPGPNPLSSNILSNRGGVGESMYSRKLEEKLPADDLLHQMIIGKEEEAADMVASAGEAAEAGKSAGADGDQDLRQGDNKNDETIKMLCLEHKAPAVFFSQ